MFHQRSFSTVQYKITATLTPDKSHAMSSNEQFVKIVGTRGETQEEECLGNFNVNPGDDVTCKLRSKLYVGTVTCVEWRTDGDDGLGLSQVCKIRRLTSHTVLSAQCAFHCA